MLTQTKKRSINLRGFSLLCILMLFVTLTLTGCSAKTSEISIIYTTDAHGHVVTDESTIGLDVVAAIKKATPNSILLDAGDFAHGLPIATLSEGQDIVKLMKLAGYQAVAVGNHEFSYSVDALQQRANEAAGEPNSMQILSANIFMNNSESELLFPPYTIVEVNGVKVGIFALTTPETMDAVLQSISAKIDITDPIQAAQQAVADLEEENCDLIVALTHIGSDPAVVIKSMDIANAVTGIDVVVDGHSHLVLDERTENGTVIVSSGEHGGHVGVLKLTMDLRKNEVLSAENTLFSKEDTAQYEPNEEITNKAKEIIAEQEKMLSEVVGETLVDLIGEKQVVRTGETNFGNLCADAMKEATGADIGLINGGNIRATIQTGDITQGDIITALPYNNIIVTKSVTGAQLLEIVEHGLSQLPSAEGMFLQIAGIRIVINPDNPVGERLVSIEKTDGSEIDLAAEYIISTNEFIADGGDGFPVLKERPILTDTQVQNDIILDYLNKTDTLAYPSGQPSRILIETN